MKAIMISDKPIWCALMMNGEKTIEVRKNKALANAIQKLIDENGYADIYVYCTKEKSLIYTDGTDGKGDYVDYQYYESYKGDKNDIGSGKVVFKFRCYKVEEIGVLEFCGMELCHGTETCKFDLYEKSCSNEEEMHTYLNGSRGYAIHISKLEIFDKPRELSEFRHDCSCWLEDHNMCKRSSCKYFYTDYEEYGCFKIESRAELTKAPQNFCYIESEE